MNYDGCATYAKSVLVNKFYLEILSFFLEVETLHKSILFCLLIMSIEEDKFTKHMSIPKKKQGSPIFFLQISSILDKFSLYLSYKM